MTSVISQAVRAFERRSGATFFLGTTGSVGLTDADERLLSRAKMNWPSRRPASNFWAARPTSIFACGNLRFDLWIGRAEGCYQRLQQDRHHHAAPRGATICSARLPSPVCDLACGNVVAQ